MSTFLNKVLVIVPAVISQAESASRRGQVENVRWGVLQSRIPAPVSRWGMNLWRDPCG